jgi:hypothetical protein
LRSIWERGVGVWGYVKYIINISNYITGITINQINYVITKNLYSPLSPK